MIGWMGQSTVRVVRVVKLVKSFVGMLGSSSQHNVLSENKRVYDLRSFSSSIKENVR